MIHNYIFQNLSTLLKGGAGIERDNLDESLNPRDDFYKYACGGWMKSHPLQPEYSRFGTFDLLRENNRTRLNNLISELGSNPDSKIKGTNAQKVRDIYALGMDEKRLNAEGAAPLIPYLKSLEESDVTSREGFARTLANMHSGIGGGFFSMGVSSDAMDSDKHLMHIGEAGLGLGDRDYYLEKSERNDAILAAYDKYVKRVMELAGASEEEQQRIRDINMKIETKLAQSKMTREMRRDPRLRYNLMSYEDFKKRYSNFDWDTYFSELKIEGLDKLNVVNPAYMDMINELIPSLSEREIKDLFALEIITEASNLLSDDFFMANFEMYDKVMSGKEEPEPRWKRAMGITSSMLGEAIGQLYVDRYFPEENKTYMLTMVDNLKKALGQHIEALTWMSPETKKLALEKLAAFTVKIGYPDKWKDYRGIVIDPEKSYLENVLGASKWYLRDNLDRLHKPVDKTEWHMTPQTVNAYYSPVTNEICFPAGILQPPYFDPKADDAINYGAIGVVIGHEMTHGFDDQGRRFDKDGNLKEWWKPEDAEKFKNLSEKLVKQFDEVEVAPGTYANGRYTLGENIADQGGLRIALTAYRNHLAANNDKGRVIDGMTPEQRFYLSYANVWAGNIREEEILSRVKTDPHSLGEHRVNETLKNISPFLEAFSILPGDKMYRPEEERVIIW